MANKRWHVYCVSSQVPSAPKDIDTALAPPKTSSQGGHVPPGPPGQHATDLDTCLRENDDNFKILHGCGHSYHISCFPDGPEKCPSLTFVTQTRKVHRTAMKTNAMMTRMMLVVVLVKAIGQSLFLKVACSYSSRHSNGVLSLVPNE